MSTFCFAESDIAFSSHQLKPPTFQVCMLGSWSWHHSTAALPHQESCAAVQSTITFRQRLLFIPKWLTVRNSDLVSTDSRAAAFLWVGFHFYPSPQLNFTGVCLIYMPEPTRWSTFLWSLVAQWRHTFMIRSPSFRHTCTSTQMTNISQWFNTDLSGLKYRHRTLWQRSVQMISLLSKNG